MAYDVFAYKVVYLYPTTAQTAAGGTITLSLAPADVPAAPNVVLIDLVTVQCPQALPVPCALYDVDPTVSNRPPAAMTIRGNLDQGGSDTGIVIGAGANLYLQWVGVLPGVLCSARVQFRLARPVTVSSSPQAQPILGP